MFCIAYFIFLLLIVLTKPPIWQANLKLFNVTGEVVKFQGKDVLKNRKRFKSISI
jgi:hypothetical protein